MIRKLRYRKHQHYSILAVNLFRERASLCPIAAAGGGSIQGSVLKIACRQRNRNRNVTAKTIDVTVILNLNRVCISSHQLEILVYSARPKHVSYLFNKD